MMQKIISRGARFVGLVAIVILPFQPLAQAAADTESRLTELEKTSGGRLGVYAIDTGSGQEISHRADERFPLCSTFKVMAAAAVLQRSAKEGDLLAKQITYAKADLVTYSPITEKQTDTGMSVAQLCAAALQYSDNTAGNLLLRLIGGPAGLTAFARRTGNETFRLDRIETELNTAIPGDPLDTVTPRAMARSLQAFTLGDALPPAQREQLVTWLRGNTTGAKRIRAGTPAVWQVGDKTGSGDYGSANDIAVLWPPEGKPIVLAIYHAHVKPEAKWNNDVIAAATRTVLEALGGAQKADH